MINVLSELDRIGYKYEHSGGEHEIIVLCPFHNDHSPTCNINTEKRVYNCHSCKSSGDIYTFFAGVLKTSREAVIYDFGQRYVELFEDKIVEVSVIEKYHTAIWENSNYINALKYRGVTEEMIRQYRLGVNVNQNRITIPIKNIAGVYVGLRLYRPGAEGKDKMKGLRGYNEPRLFPIEQLKYDRIMICGGEIKAIVAAAQLNPHGIGAISTTMGEGNWSRDFTKHFKDKHIWVCFDVDPTGKHGSEFICGNLNRVASWIGIINLPLDIVKYPHGDINDFIAQEHGNLFDLIPTAEEWEPQILKDEKYQEQEEAIEVALSAACSERYVKKLVKFNGIIAGKTTEAWYIPEKIRVECPRDKECCAICKIFNCKPEQEYTIMNSAPVVLEIADANETQMQKSLKSYIGIPHLCNVSRFHEITHKTVEICFVQPPLDMHIIGEHRELSIYCINNQASQNDAVEIVARILPHPKDRSSTVLAAKCIPTQDTLLKFECTEENLAELRMFQPDEWTLDAIHKTLEYRYDDLEINVTHIYGRHDMHLIFDLVYHSIIYFGLGNDKVKGWVKALILGDTSQGKSQTFNALQRHYNLGDKEDSKNSTIAGVLGGVESINDRRFLKWGVLVRNDRGLVCFEEAKNMSETIMPKLTNTLTEGTARIGKIARGAAHARTRVIFLSNPLKPHMSDYSFGIEAFAEIMGSTEDTRRLDIGYIAASGDVSQELREHRQQEILPHVHTSSICRKLILWAWSREENDVIILPETRTAIFSYTKLLLNQFSERIALIDEGSTHEKLAKLSVALAVLTFSTDNGGIEKLVVRPIHVEYIYNFLVRIYSSKACGYQDFTKHKKASSELVNREGIKAFVKERFSSGFVHALLNSNKFGIDDFTIFLGSDRLESMKHLSYLYNSNAIVKNESKNGSHTYYRNSSQFIDLLKGIIFEFEEPSNKPEFISNDESF